MSVQQVLSGLQRAWNAGDGSAFAEHFSEDADLVDVVGRLQHGRPEIARRHQQIFGAIYRDSRNEFRLPDEREVAPASCWRTPARRCTSRPVRGRARRGASRR